VGVGGLGRLVAVLRFVMHEPAIDMPLIPTRRAMTRARVRRHRQRQRDGRLVVTVELTPQMTDTLCRLRYLDTHELEDRARIAQAIRALLGSIITEEL
jgi:hypothetical protein